MFKIGCTFLLLILSYSVSCQIKGNLNLMEGSDTLYNYKFKNRNVSTYNLSYIENSIATHAFRFSRSGLIITVLKTNGYLYGEVNQYVNAHDEDGHWADKIFKKTNALDTLQVQQIFNLIDSTSINAIPSEKYIKEWGQGFDGVTYVFENKIDNNYSIKSYWTPTAQRDVKEAVAIENFVQQLYTIIKLNSLRKSFDNIIPFDAYSNGSGWVAMRVLTRQEARKKRRLKRKSES